MVEVCEGAPVAVGGWVLTDRHDLAPCAAGVVCVYTVFTMPPPYPLRSQTLSEAGPGRFGRQIHGKAWGLVGTWYHYGTHVFEQGDT